ncbi:hypothetical protein [Geothrix oryzisoli]|uniref:hypothetical protein n=1 Tax=Geothrix oryzisoli TaxID=2922721 RepID=UPI001FAC00B5|nr:hypothetical protein [Geothrix oryzisoli]
MARLLRPSALLWGLLLLLGAAAVGLRLRAPGHRALPWLTGAFLVLLALRVVGMILAWRRQQLPGTRLLLPALLLVEGLGLVLSRAPGLTLWLRLGTALALEILLLALAIRAWRTTRALPGAWPEDRIAAAFEAFVPPRAARLMAFELVLLGSALRFLGGGFREAAPRGFSHHRESGLHALLPALPLLIPGDILLMKALFSGLAPWLRWVLHASTVYAVLWLFGFYATLKARPHQIEDGQVHLHQGLVKSVAFPARWILAAAPLPSFDDDWARHAHMKGMPRLVARGTPMLELKLSEPVRVSGLLGPGRPTTRLAISVDDPAAFLAALGAACA